MVINSGPGLGGGWLIGMEGKHKPTNQQAGFLIDKSKNQTNHRVFLCIRVKWDLYFLSLRLFLIFTFGTLFCVIIGYHSWWVICLA